MIVTIHQPDFLPWLGFFQRWLVSDVFVILDDVQYLRRGWHNRDKIKTPSGPKWLTVPVRSKDRYTAHINSMELDGAADWQTRHLNQLRHAYAKAPNLEPVLEALTDIYRRAPSDLMGLNLELLAWAGRELGVERHWTLSSSYGFCTNSSRKLLDLVQAVGGTAYLTGTGSRDYLDEDLFRRAGIKVLWQEFVQPNYPQLHGEFIPGLSVLDYLLMVPPAQRSLSGWAGIGDGGV